MPSVSPQVKKFSLGDFDCYIVYDGFRSIGSMTSGSAKKFIFGDAPEEELHRELVNYGGLDSSTIIQFNFLLINNCGNCTLVDTGCGERAENLKHQLEPAGLLNKSLNKAGIRADDIDRVIISHSHWDHFGGAVTKGEATYPNAEYIMNKIEADYIRDKNDTWAQNYLNILEDKLVYLEGDQKLDQGILVKSAPGHTPGMTIVEVSSGYETLLYTSDIIIHPAHVTHTNWIPSFEDDRIAATATRSKLVEDAYRRGLLLFVPHIYGVLGRISYSQSKFMWIDES